MAQLRLLKIIVFISLLAVILLPVYIFLFAEPAFEDFITEKTEAEAVKVATHMSSMVFVGKKPISKTDMTDTIKEGIAQLQEEFHIVKVKVFAPNGEVIYSTIYEDIGIINTNPYFHNEVANGLNYTKIVRKNKKTMEGETLPVDVVETYVPIMSDRTFAGAFEIYYDITETKKQLDKLLLLGKQTSIGLSLCLLFAVIFSSFQAFQSIKTRIKAEEELREAHADLENRIMRRTSELEEANTSLHQEIIVRKETEAEKETLIQELKDALEQVKTLRGLLPICSSCQRIRDSEGTWNRIDDYIQEHTEVELTHGICPKCAKNLYPDLYSELEKDKE